MARIPYFDETAHPETADLVARLRAGRRGGLINVYRLLLHSPALAETWFDHVSAVRWRTELSGRLREIVIIRIAHLNAIDYVFRQHIPAMAEAEGLSVSECDALADWRAASCFDAAERAALAYVDALVQSTSVPDDVFDALRGHFDARGIVELSVLAGTYLMHNRVMKALAIDLEPTSAQPSA
jgi:alkylhydroperoxidase family enzyme